MTCPPSTIPAQPEPRSFFPLFVSHLTESPALTPDQGFATTDHRR